MTTYLNTKAYCKLTPVFEVNYFTSSEDEDSVKSVIIDREKKYIISAYKDSTGQLIDYIGKIVRVNIRYNPNSALISLDGNEHDIQIMAILLDCSEDCVSKRELINVCDIRHIEEFIEEVNDEPDDEP